MWEISKMNLNRLTRKHRRPLAWPCDQPPRFGAESLAPVAQGGMKSVVTEFEVQQRRRFP